MPEAVVVATDQRLDGDLVIVVDFNNRREQVVQTGQEGYFTGGAAVGGRPQ